MLLFVLGLVFTLPYSSHCEMSWDRVYALLSARLDEALLNMKLEQNTVSKKIQYLTAMVTSTNQQLKALEEKLRYIDNHVINVAVAEVGRRTHLLRRRLEQEKASTQSRLNSVQKIQADVQSDINVLMSATDNYRVQISGVEEKIKSTMNQQAELISAKDEMNTLSNETRVQISYVEQNIENSVGRIEILEKTHLDMKGVANKTQAHIATVEQKLSASQSNTHTLLSRAQSLKGTQANLKSNTRAIESQVDTAREQIVGRIETVEKTQSDMNKAANKTQAQILTMEQKVAATQSYTQTLQSRVRILEWTQADDKSNAITIELPVDTTRGQTSRVQQTLGTFAVTFVGFSVVLETKNSYYSKDTVISFDKVYYNEGSHYSPSSHDTLRAVGALTGWNAAVLKVWAGDRVYVSTANQQEPYYI